MDNKKTVAMFGSIIAAFIVLFTPTAEGATSHSDCDRVAGKDRAVCRQVLAQHAYGWTNAVGDPQNWMVKGRLLVRDITHQGYSKAEMGDALRAEHKNYRRYVTNVSFNLDALVKKCGHTYGAYGVQYIEQDGRLYTWKQIICD